MIEAFAIVAMILGGLGFALSLAQIVRNAERDL